MSADVVIESPMSFAGSAKRSWQLVGMVAHPAAKVAVAFAVVAIVLVWWTLIACWYLTWGLLVVPWRVFRRGQRKQKRDARRHGELLAAVKR